MVMNDRRKHKDYSHMIYRREYELAQTITILIACAWCLVCLYLIVKENM